VKCPNCGASFEITPDALAYACKYCGWIGTTEDVEQKGFFMVEPLEFDKIKSQIGDFIGKNLGGAYREIRIIESRPTVVPVWMVQVHAYTRYNGYRQEIKVESYPVTVSNGKGTRTVMRTRTYPVYVPVRGEFDESPIVPIVARKHSAFFGIDEIKKKAAYSTPQQLDVKKLLGKKFECLEVELSEDEAKPMAETEVEDEHRARADKMTTKLFDCYTDTDVLSTKLVFYPVYTLVYEYRGKSFRGTVDGADGGVVKIELPMTLGLKVIYLTLGYVGIAVSFLLGLRIDIEASIYIIPLTLASILAFYKGTTSQRIKRSL